MGRSVFLRIPLVDWDNKASREEAGEEAAEWSILSKMLELGRLSRLDHDDSYYGKLESVVLIGEG